MHRTVDCESPCSSESRVKRTGLAGMAEAGQSIETTTVAAQRATRTSLSIDLERFMVFHTT